MRRKTFINYLTACVLLLALILGAACSPQKDSGNRTAAAAAFTELTETEAVKDNETEAPVTEAVGTAAPETEPEETESPTEVPAETEVQSETDEPTEPEPETEAPTTEAVIAFPSEDGEEAAETAGDRQAAPEETEPQITYVLNKNTRKFHEPSCSSVGDIKPENRWDFTGTREEALEMGYVPCKRCNP